jgi:hypothetical protein
VQLYGNCLPLDSEIEVFKKISDRTNIPKQEVERIFNNQSNPFSLSILKERSADSKSFCCIKLNHYYTGNMDVLPRTKKMLDMELLK